MSKLAIISVWDKTGVIELAQALVMQGYTIISTGGTYNKLCTAIDNQYLRQVSDLTGFPQVLGGRVKTLHPVIHAGILAREDQQQELEDLGIGDIKVVVANLYPFSQTVARGASEDETLENIDIGGHTLIRAAAKNYHKVLVLVDPADYPQVILGTVDRKAMAAKAYSHAAEYDIHIAQYFGDQSVRKYTEIQSLKYGCNPHQQSAALCGINTIESPLQVLNGNVGYINLLDALLGFQLVTEAQQVLRLPVAASYKHTSPAGVGVGKSLSVLERVVFDVEERHVTPTAAAFARARNCDPLSSFGDFIAVSSTVDRYTAELIKREVSDGIIAPNYDEDALEILRSKKSGKYIILQMNPEHLFDDRHEYRELAGVTLVQEANRAIVRVEDICEMPEDVGLLAVPPGMPYEVAHKIDQALKSAYCDIPTANKEIPQQAREDLILANIALKYTQSNSVAYAYEGQVIGIGAGQQNRVDCTKLAGNKARRWCNRFSAEAVDELRRLKALGTKRTEINNSMAAFCDNSDCTLETQPGLALASDAFFPFPDSIEVAAARGVKYILQPGGSNGDPQCIKACDDAGIAMVMTNKRMFLH